MSKNIGKIKPIKSTPSLQDDNNFFICSNIFCHPCIILTTKPPVIGIIVLTISHTKYQQVSTGNPKHLPWVCLPVPIYIWHAPEKGIQNTSNS
jgi:hypothetical protein